jgi:hypothetical protein
MLEGLKRLFSKEQETPSSIGVLYICTGKYNIFWKEFYASAVKYFCKNSEVHFFVFSDEPVDTFGNNKVHVYHQPKLGWPYDTLRRFHIFLAQKEQLSRMDFLYYFNANMLFKRRITEKMILPYSGQDSSGLVGVLHPWHYNRKPEELIYDRTPGSTANIKIGEGEKYFQGCLSGGTSTAYLNMCEKLKENIDKDEANGIIALWHDESHINHFFISHPPKQLHPGYAYPENMKLPFTRLIVQLDKAKAGGHEFLRS